MQDGNTGTWGGGQGCWDSNHWGLESRSAEQWEAIEAAVQEEMDRLKELELEELEYRLERRERKQRKARGRMPMHGKDLLRDRRSRIRGLR